MRDPTRRVRVRNATPTRRWPRSPRSRRIGRGPYLAALHERSQMRRRALRVPMAITTACSSAGHREHPVCAVEVTAADVLDHRSTQAVASRGAPPIAHLAERDPGGLPARAAKITDSTGCLAVSSTWIATRLPLVAAVSSRTSSLRGTSRPAARSSKPGSSQAPTADAPCRRDTTGLANGQEEFAVSRQDVSASAPTAADHHPWRPQHRPRAPARPRPGRGRPRNKRYWRLRVASQSPAQRPFWSLTDPRPEP